jgi:Cof subfamily protein (haloacid dehalogenase superfamily)
MGIRLLATDLDGTLLDDFKRLTSKNIQALQEAHQSGVQVVICTGRPYHTVKPYLSLLKIPCWLITNNGAVIRNPEGTLINTSYIQYDSLKHVMEILVQHPRLYFHGSDAEYTYIDSRWRRMHNIYRFERKSRNSPMRAMIHAAKTVWLTPVHRTVNFSQFAERGGQLANIIIISGNTEALKQKKHELEPVKGISLTRSGHDNLEILDSSTNKGTALKTLSEYLSIPPDSIAAIGDHDNDLSMILMAGLGMATGNAEKVIREQADYVTETNNEDALWHAWQRINALL